MNEMSWLLGNLLCALGVVLCTKANLGLSMIAAPPYIFNQFLVKYVPWFTQGTAEYFFQAVLLVLLCIIVRKFTPKFLLSFVTAVFFGKCIDMWLFMLGGQTPFGNLWMRVLALVAGELITALAIAFYFRTDLPLCIYELTVLQISKKYDKTVSTVKAVHDYIMLAVAIVSSLILFHGFVGIGVGTVVITLVNAPLIRMFGVFLDRIFTFESAFPNVTSKLKI